MVSRRSIATEAPFKADIANQQVSLTPAPSKAIEACKSNTTKLRAPTAKLCAEKSPPWKAIKARLHLDAPIAANGDGDPERSALIIRPRCHLSTLWTLCEHLVRKAKVCQPTPLGSALLQKDHIWVILISVAAALPCVDASTQYLLKG
mmetsp:Transcript_81144/g.181443  ORF Transcript_81144/g.181443 Transcript_81144/m.181443 type:complete len:148 (-) Transcript_81144:463-906(-)